MLYRIEWQAISTRLRSLDLGECCKSGDAKANTRCAAQAEKNGDCNVLTSSLWSLPIVRLQRKCLKPTFSQFDQANDMIGSTLILSMLESGDVKLCFWRCLLAAWAKSYDRIAVLSREDVNRGQSALLLMLDTSRRVLYWTVQEHEASEASCTFPRVNRIAPECDHCMSA